MAVIEIVLLVYFAYVSLYAFILSVAALTFRMPVTAPSPLSRKFAVLIPSYREDAVIVDVARQALQQSYNRSCYDVVVVADSLKSETLNALRQLPVRLVEVVFEKSTKVRALNAAMQAIGDDYEYAVILDADNVMEPDFLKKINELIDAGYACIQCERTSKNASNSMSVLDGFSERINNFVYRQGHVAIGLYCSLIGSGMVFPYPTFRKIMSGLDSIGGFDRELELSLIRSRNRIWYGKNILVFDEKVESTEVFEKQRRRWLSSQFIYLRKYFGEGMRALFRLDMVMFNSAILKNVQLPRLINLGLLAVLCVASVIFRKHLHFGVFPWFACLLLSVTAIALAIPLRYYNREMLLSLLLLPKVFLKMINILFRLKGANRTFIHTPHGVGNSASNKEK